MPEPRSSSLTAAVLLFLALAVAAQEPPAGEDQPPDPERIAALRAEAEKALGEVPADATPESQAGQLKTALERRLALLTEHEELVAEAEADQATAASLEARIQAARDAAAELEEQPLPPVPDQPSQEGLGALTDEITTVRERLAGVRSRLDENRKRLDGVQEARSQATTRADGATQRITQLTAEPGEADEEAQALRRSRLANARLDLHAANRRLAVLEGIEGLSADEEPVLAAEQQLAELQLERLEQTFAAYSQVLERQLVDERAQRESELAALEERATNAESPAERFRATWEAAIIQAEINRVALDAELILHTRELNEQEKRLADEKDELGNIRELVRVSGVSGAAADRIKTVFGQLPGRYKQLSQFSRLSLPTLLNDHRGRRFQIEDTLFGLGENLRDGRERLAALMPEGEARSFRRETRDLQERVRTALRDERSKLTEAILLGQKLGASLLARAEVLDRLDAFVRSKVFWVRDAKPLNLEALARLPAEAGRIAQWGVGAVQGEDRDRLTELLGESGSVLYGLLLFVALPILLGVLRQRMRRVVRRANARRQEAGAEEQASPWAPVRAVGMGALSALLLPAYLALASKIVGAALPGAAITGPVVITLQHLAVFLLGWFLSRSLFAGSATATVQLGLDRGAARTLHRVLRVALLGWLVWLLPWRLLRAPPLELAVMPRLAFVAFVATTLVCAIILFRRSSAFVRALVLTDSGTAVERYWPLISAISILLPAAILTAEALGYSYGARAMLSSYGMSVGTLMLLPPLHRLVAALGASRIRRQLEAAAPLAEDAAAAADAEAEEPLTDESREALRLAQVEADADAARSQQNLAGFVRLAFMIAGVLLVAGYWGLSHRALGALDEVAIYEVTRAGADPEVVSAADLLRCALTLAGTFLVFKAIPGLYMLLLSTRPDIDPGARYAMQTISGYVLVAFGIVMALTAIHLDLGRLGWLVAAMGVGLGFGLQEIISNFVSGLILLVERPIRVGDIVTVGTYSGTVLRINIRSTTVLNFDRQEVIVPNRSLITGDVTNWTRGDTINRVVVPIGVAYGSDVDEVTAILQKVCRDIPEVLDDPGSVVLFMAHGASSLDFEVRVFVASVSEKLPVMDRLNKEINRRLAAAGIEIPFPQQDVHIRSAPPGLASEGEPPARTDGQGL